LQQRFQLQQCPVDPESHVLPVSGTREALFSIAQAVIDRSKNTGTQQPVVVSPNPFYQIYEGAAFLAGADIHFINCNAENNYLMDFSSVSPDVWRRTQMLYLCTPGNPSGAVIPLEQLKQVIALADEYDFVIASDECYSELYFGEQAPPGLLQACESLGRSDFSRCVVFHSLSKRSNLPGMRSGFVAGDAKVLKDYLLYRTYHGCALSLPTQWASIAAWQDEQHVQVNREKYRKKFLDAAGILSSTIDLQVPEASFYLWLQTPIDDLQFTQRLFSEHNVTVLPGSFIARDTAEGNPGNNHVRIALVATEEECREALQRIQQFLAKL
jgi:N-succinyldiaminopimelate aminotransferase